MTEAHTKQRYYLWDRPVRLIHWAIVLLTPTLWWTAENHMMNWHRTAGYAMLWLIVVRLLWGCFGSTPARFVNFVRGPAAVLSHLRYGSGPLHPGHSPLGGWSVLAMLGALIAQVTLGLFAIDVDGIESGPLSAHVDFDNGRMLAEWHGKVFYLLLALIAFHVAAILFYLTVKRTNLVSSMITGYRPGARPVDTVLRFAKPWILALIIILAALFTYWIMTNLTFDRAQWI
jgi:cytochrome b